MPTARAAHEALVTALADQASWAARTTAAKELLAAMLASRRSAADLAKQYDIRCGGSTFLIGGISIRWLYVSTSAVGLSV